MLAKIALRTYFAGVGAIGLYGLSFNRLNTFFIKMNLSDKNIFMKVKLNFIYRSPMTYRRLKDTLQLMTLKIRKKNELLEEPDIVEPLLSEFLRYSGACGVGFSLGVAFGFMWPIALIGKTISTINELDIITKNS